MLEEKIEALTTEVVALRKAIEAGGVNTGSGTAEDSAETAKKPAAKKPAAAAKKAPAKKAAAKPKHTEDEVAAVMRQAAKEVDKDAIVEYINEQGCDDLADLLTKPELFDAAYAFATDMLPEDEEEEEDEEI